MAHIVTQPDGPTTDEQLAIKTAIALRLLNCCLLSVGSHDGKVHHGGIVLPKNQFNEPVEEAAKAMIEAGIGWCEFS